jgi:MFS family permease
MADATASADDQTLGRRRRYSRLMIFFALAYFTEGTGQVQTGLIYQPLYYYLKQVWHWTPVQVAAMMTVTWLPWVIKPLYGIVSDFLPLFGYRRRYYLILTNALASCAYVAMAWAVSPGSVIFFVMLTAYGMASASTLYGALLVEGGHEFTASGSFVNQQYLWFNIAQVGVPLLGGALVQYLPPTTALHVAALIAGVVPLSVIVGSLFLVREQHAEVSIEGLKRSFRALGRTFTRTELYVLAAFIFVYRLNPGVGGTTAFYYYQTDHMKFSQAFIGVLSSATGVGWVLGALLYRRFLENVSSKTILNLSIAAGVISNLTYFLLTGEVSALWISFLSGMAFSINYVASIGIAADYCPPGAEGFAFALLMSIDNVAGSASDNAGSYLYEHVSAGTLPPLILASAAITAIGFALLPLLKLGDKKQGAPVLALAQTGQSAGER